MTKNSTKNDSLDEILQREIPPEEVTESTPEEIEEHKENILLQALETLNNTENKN